MQLKIKLKYTDMHNIIIYNVSKDKYSELHYIYTGLRPQKEKKRKKGKSKPGLHHIKAKIFLGGPSTICHPFPFSFARILGLACKGQKG